MDGRSARLGEELDDLTLATALYFTRAVAFWQRPDETLLPDLRRSAEGFRRAGDLSGEGLAYISLGLAQLGAVVPPDPVGAQESLERALASMREQGDSWGEGFALITIGRVELLLGRLDSALDRFASSLDIAKRRGDRHAESIAQYHIGWVRLLLGQPDEARTRFGQNLDLSCRLAHDEGIAYGLEGLTAVAAADGEAERAGLLFGASEVLRERTGLYNMQPFIVTTPFVDRLLDGPDALTFEAARGRGRALPVADAVSFALGG
ncbi:tetratricopeptide repeat protein [Agromyces sp. MMS24-K17]|uniref:tetratricopeptide repeat protein n=1 Tax=Agromyces sp. MMS24-K17 TaxID=3372850 RepID=UPI003754E73F